MTSATKSLAFVDVSRLLAPRSIAVIGASEEPGNLGGVAIRMLQKFHYPGAIWPIHPRRPEVRGIWFARRTKSAAADAGGAH